MSEQKTGQIKLECLYSEVAERVVLGSLLLGGKWDVQSEVFEAIQTPEVFYFLKHRIIWEEMCEIHASGVVVDMSAVGTRLLSVDQTRLRLVGGMGVLDDLYATGVATGVGYQVSLLVDYWRRRKLYDWSNKLQKSILTTTNFSSLHSKAMEALHSVGAGGVVQRPIFGPGMYTQERERVLAEEVQISRIRTGYPSLDVLLHAGLVPGDLTVLAARPSVGKSATKANFTINWLEAGVGVFSYSPQQGFATEIRRIESIYTQIPYGELGNRAQWCGEFDGKKIEHVKEVAEKLDTRWPLWFWDKRGQTLDGVMREVDRVKSAGAPISIVTIDLLKDLEDVKGEENKPQSYDRVLGNCRTWAQRLDVHMVVLHQISRRGVVWGKGGVVRPNMEDLKDSGAFEEEADNLILLFREAFYAPQRKDDQMELIVAKQRNGPRNKLAVMAWYPETMTLVDKGESWSLEEYLTSKKAKKTGGDKEDADA